MARFRSRETMRNPDITNAISHATCTTAIDLNAAAIITVTQSGRTARMISKYRPDCTIIDTSPAFSATSTACSKSSSASFTLSSFALSYEFFASAR